MCSLKKIVAYYHKSHATWSDVFLRTGIDQRIFFQIDRLREDVGRSVTDDRYSAGIEIVMKFHSVDRFVRCVMNICGILTKTKISVLRNGTKAGLLTAKDSTRYAVMTSLTKRLKPP